MGWEGLEPSTNALKGRCSTIELPTRPGRGKFRGAVINAPTLSAQASKINHAPKEYYAKRRETPAWADDRCESAGYGMRGLVGNAKWKSIPRTMNTFATIISGAAFAWNPNGRLGRQI